MSPVQIPQNNRRDRLIDDLERQFRNIARRGDALFGCEDFRDATFFERARGLLGFHDETQHIRRRNDARPRKGDVIGVSRGWFDHYGIYAGRQQVIHFWSKDSDIGGNRVVQTSVNDFLRGDARLFVLQFSGRTLNSLEVIERARSRLGDDTYDLFRHNCEHFVFWCKTGQAESHQICRVHQLLSQS